MAARRLLIMMLILLGISSVIAVIIPNPRRDAREQKSRQEASEGNSKASGSGTGSEQGTTGGSAATGGSTGENGNAGSTKTAGGSEPGPLNITLEPGKSPQKLEATPGERVILTVKVESPSQVMVPELGLNGFGDRWAPAVFDLILPATKADIEIFTTPSSGQPRTLRATIKSN